MNKKLFVWFCGTDTTSTDMADLKNALLTGRLADEKGILILSGIGTADNKTATEQMSPEPFYKRLINYCGRYISKDFQNIIDSIYGYREEHQLAQVYQVMTGIIEQMTAFSEDKGVDAVELVIGGHSRGAAAGMLGLLSALRASLSYGAPEQWPAFRKLRKITLIPVDPVAGPKGNDLLQSGLKVPVAQLLDSMQQQLKNPQLFEIISYNARFDARDDFALDAAWAEFFRDVLSGRSAFTSKVRFFRAGFRHSAMILKTEEIISLYRDTPGCTPRALLQAIITGCMLQQRTIGNAVEEMAARVGEAELAAIRQLIGGADTDLTRRTTMSSYGVVTGYTLKGAALQEVLKRGITTGEPLWNRGRLLLGADETKILNKQ